MICLTFISASYTSTVRFWRLMEATTYYSFSLSISLQVYSFYSGFEGIRTGKKHVFSLSKGIFLNFMSKPWGTGEESYRSICAMPNDQSSFSLPAEPALTA